MFRRHSENARPMVMFTSLSRPGPSAERGLMPSSLAIGPFTTSIGACGLVDISSDLPPCSPISDSVLTAAMITGICSGFAPASAAFTAIFSTVASPNPGGISHTRWSGGRCVPASSSSTASLVAGYIGIASPQSLLRKSEFIRSTAS